MEHTIQRVTKGNASLKEFTNMYRSYIKWADRPSRKLYWSLHEESKMVGVFALSSAFTFPGVIKEYMAERSIVFNEVGNNIIYCLKGQEDRNAGTKFLKLCRLDAKLWWRERYADELKLMQTFILPTREDGDPRPRIGAVYKADNWTFLGMTKGETQGVRSLYGEDREKYKDDPRMEIRRFQNGETKYLLREYRKTEE